MPRYQFTGPVETVLFGLSHGVNATLHRDGHGQPDGSTLVARPGDEITTKKPYRHTHMSDVKAADTTTPPAPAETARSEGAGE